MKQPGDRDLSSEMGGAAHDQHIRIRLAEYFTNSEGKLDCFPVALTLKRSELAKLCNKHLKIVSEVR